MASTPTAAAVQIKICLFCGDIDVEARGLGGVERLADTGAPERLAELLELTPLAELPVSLRGTVATVRGLTACPSNVPDGSSSSASSNAPTVTGTPRSRAALSLILLPPIQTPFRLFRSTITYELPSGRISA